jgi:hypothetical protein
MMQHSNDTGNACLRRRVSMRCGGSGDYLSAVAPNIEPKEFIAIDHCHANAVATNDSSAREKS